MKLSVNVTSLLLGVIVGVGITVAVTNKNPEKSTIPPQDLPSKPEPTSNEINQGTKSQAVRERWTLA